MLLHVFLGTEDKSAGWTRLDAGGLTTHCNAIRAQRALVSLVIPLRDSRDVERATGDAVAATDAVLFVKIDDAVGILHDRAGRRARLQAARIRAVHAAILADQPLQISVALRILVLCEAHQRPGMLGEIGWV